MARTKGSKNKPKVVYHAVDTKLEKEITSSVYDIDKSLYNVLPKDESPTELDGIRLKVFLDRYSNKDEKGNPIEHFPENAWRRVAVGLASVEKTPELRAEWVQKFYESLKDFKFIPGGRILSGAGTGYEVTFYNCFVLPSPHDSRGGIIDNLKIMVEMLSRGGGAGINLSSLRPKGSRVKKVNGHASGPVNWAELYSVATHDIIQQGGCFTEDTKIMTHRGLVSIKEIVEGTQSYYAATHYGYQEITTKFNNGIKNLYEVRTEAGFKVKVTEEHRFLTVDSHGRFHLKKISNFKVGETAILLLGNWPNELPYVALSNNLPAPSKYSNRLKNIKLPKVLNEKLAFLLGVYDADGSRIKDKYSSNGKGLRIAVAEDRPKDLEKIIQTVKDVFNVESKVLKGDGAVKNLHIYSRVVNEFLKHNNILKISSSNVQVPDQLFNSPKKVVEAYIAGVFVGDGTNRGGKGGFRITTVSQKFAQSLQLLLINLGIASRIKIQERRGLNWQTIYTLTITGHKFMARFYEIISSYTEKANNHGFSIRDGAFNWPFNLIERFAYLSGFQRTIARTNPTTSQKATLFLAQRLSTITQLKDKTDVEFLTSCVPDKISSITFIGEGKTYDLEVNKTHLLSGNGFYTSNSRRGALMLMLHDWHPDVEDFITVKQDLVSIKGANLSVCVSDAFMEAVKSDLDWELSYPNTQDPDYDKLWDGDLKKWQSLGKKVEVWRTVKARHLWHLIAEAAWKSAEPGVVFMERYNKFSNTWYYENIQTVNPCGEQGLPAWGVCNLGSVNLAAFVRDDGMDYDSLANTVKVAMRFLDNVVDANFYFYEENERQQKSTRRTGLGTMGLGDALIKLKVRYGTPESLEIIEKIYRTIRDTAYVASSDIAAEKGPFSNFDKEKYLQGSFIKKLPSHIQQKIALQGIRNAVLLTQAPTGSTSLLTGVSSGIEPIYDFALVRRDRIGEHVLYHPLYKEWKDKHPEENMPDYFVSANDLTPEEHIKVQAVIQTYTDSSISKTVNAPNSHTIEDVKTLYTLAYDLGCKGITYMRDGSREGVLSHIEEKKITQEEQTSTEVKLSTPVELRTRPDILYGASYRVKTPVGTAFITVNSDENGYPFEVFINVGKAGSDITADAETIGRLISLAFRIPSAYSPKAVAEQLVLQLRGIGGSESLGFGNGRVRSLADAVAKVIEDHLKGIKPDSVTTTAVQETLDFNNPNKVATLKKDLCPTCGQATLIYEEGCGKCYNCGFSKC